MNRVTEITQERRAGPDLLAEHMQVTLDAKAVPAFVLQAHGLAHAGQSEAALALLNETHLSELESLPAGSDVLVSTMTVLGSTWRRLGRAQEAAEAYECVQAVRTDAGVIHELIALYRSMGQFTRAFTWAETAMQKWPHYPELQSLYAECLISLGRLDDGLCVLKALVDTERATAGIHNLYNWYLSYVEDMDRQTLLAASVAWARRFTVALTDRPGHTNTPEPERRLRIGYLSSDFRTHSVTYTFEPLLDGRDRASFEVFGYGNVAHPDHTTTRLAQKFDHYRDVRGQTSEGIVSKMREDGIDILVTLSAHCSATSLGVLAQKPAPLQIDIGSLNTTGLPQVDYRITDALQDPPTSQPYYTEQLVPIPGGFVPYRPPEDAPAVAPLPLLTNGQVTFGSFANHLKINDTVISWWAAVLRRTPRSRLLIKGCGGFDESVATHLVDQFAQQDIAPRRVRIVGWLPKHEHWQLFSQVDLGLDTYPFNGGLTNLEALWMGVPTVTVAGETFVSRTGLAILLHVGLAQLVARSGKEMVDKAVALAHNTDTLARLRANLRPAMAASGLCDVSRLTRGVEDVYRRIWRQWCSVQDADRRTRNDRSNVKT